MKTPLHQLFEKHLEADEIITNQEKIANLLIDKRERYRGNADIVLQPKSTNSVQAIMRLCSTHKISVTPQGGNTSLCGAATPNGGVLLSLSKMNHILKVDLQNESILVQAGAILHNVQEEALKHGKYFPLSLASEANCQIGGNIACNAGGINVLRYGNMRKLVLGLEIVLPDGSLISHLSALRKNTTGLDLQQLFIGSEGTLGIITAANLAIFPIPQNTITAWIDCDDIEECIEYLNILKNHSQGSLKSFELISDIALKISAEYLNEKNISNNRAWHILCEWDDIGNSEDLFNKINPNKLKNILISQNENQRKIWWKLRENISDAQKKKGISIKHDIALPISQINAMLNTCEKNIKQKFSDAQIVAFGHLGDGSLHYNVFLPNITNSQIYDFEEEINEIVYNCVIEHQGTIAAEHGIGQLKRQWLQKMKTQEEINLMLAIKKQLDPFNIMNPNKVYPEI